MILFAFHYYGKKIYVNMFQKITYRKIKGKVSHKSIE